MFYKLFPSKIIGLIHILRVQVHENITQGRHDIENKLKN